LSATISWYTDFRTGKDVFYAVLPYPDNNPNPLALELFGVQQPEK
jgi:hypothetical protein